MPAAAPTSSPGRRAPGRYDSEKVITANQPHGVKRTADVRKGTLKGPGARLPSGTVDQYKASERHHYDPEEPSVRFSQGVVTSARTACIAQTAKRRPAGACRLMDPNGAVHMKPVAATASVEKAAKGAVPQSENTARATGKHVINPFGSSTLLGTSLAQARGDGSTKKRSASIAASRKELADTCRPRTLNTVSAEFRAAHPDPCPARNLNDRYNVEVKPQKRIVPRSPAESAVVPPWLR